MVGEGGMDEETSIGRALSIASSLCDKAKQELREADRRGKTVLNSQLRVGRNGKIELRKDSETEEELLKPWRSTRKTSAR